MNDASSNWTKLHSKQLNYARRSLQQNDTDEQLYTNLVPSFIFLLLLGTGLALWNRLAQCLELWRKLRKVTLELWTLCY